ncbi:MAG: 23S rRNA (adenine(2503)-C(2))-methyltransferase RlmN [Peptococcaceae bacterium]|nr:23S rRNA (adenine(2503)-C(2))-methyltransferase RlmN [Peptococcaceae bacterium]
MEKIDCRSLLETELSELCAEKGLSKFRGRQIFQWVEQKGIRDWREMSNISQADREKISQFLSLRPADLIREQKSKDGTRKYLFGLADGERIETVLMGYEKDRSRDRQTICISTQVGCPVGCLFCATGMEGFKRNLTVGEITGQVLDVLRILRQENPGSKITNIVFMGMGEPLFNYKAVLKAISILNSKNGQNIGMRRMTVSTSGVVPKIIQLAQDNPQVGLAVSLHSSRDEVRDKLVPINKKYPLASLMAACRTYSQITKRRVTFEFALNNTNTNKSEAQGLVNLLKGMMAHVNLIPVNPVQGSGVHRPTREEMLMFKKILEEAEIAVSFREEKGLDIDAACGQLRQRLECERA